MISSVVVKPAMMYGLETMALTKRQEADVEAAELKIPRCFTRSDQDGQNWKWVHERYSSCWKSFLGGLRVSGYSTPHEQNALPKPFIRVWPGSSKLCTSWLLVYPVCCGLKAPLIVRLAYFLVICLCVPDVSQRMINICFGVCVKILSLTLSHLRVPVQSDLGCLFLSAVCSWMWYLQHWHIKKKSTTP